MNETPESSTSLHPALKTALASLDLTVESELAYYRQEQAKLAMPPLPESTTATAMPELEEVVLEPEETALEPEHVAPVAEQDEHAASHLDAEAVLEELLDQPQDAQDAVETPATPPPDTEALPDAALVTEEQSALVTTGDAQLLETEGDDRMIEIETPPDAALDSETAEALNTPSRPPEDFPKSYENYLDPSIEDYLESSEALLRHLEESKTEAEAKPKPKQRFSGTGLMLLALAVLALGTVFFWGLQRSRQRDPAPESPSPAPSPSLSPSPTPRSTVTPPAPATPSPATPSPSPAASPLPTPTASSVPLQPPSPVPSPSPAASP